MQLNPKYLYLVGKYGVIEEHELKKADTRWQSHETFYGERSVWLFQILYFSFQLFTSHIDKYWPQPTILSSF